MKETVVINEYRYTLITRISEKTMKLTGETIPIGAFDYICGLNEEGLRDIDEFLEMELFIKALRG